MKLPHLFLFAIGIFQRLESQIVIDNSHLPAIGDSFFSYTDTAQRAQTSLTGGVYDFSYLQKHNESVVSFQANDNTVDYPASNLKLSTSGTAAAEIYLKRATNDLSVIAFGANAIPSPIPLNPVLNGSLKYLSFPMSSGTNISSSDSLRIAIPAALLSGLVNIDSLIKTALPPPYNSGLVKITVDSIVIRIQIAMNLKSLGSGKIRTPVDSNLDVLKIERKTSFDYKLIANVQAEVPIVGKIPLSIDLSQFLGGQLPNLSSLALREHVYYTPSIRQPIVSATLDTLGLNYITTNFRLKTVIGTGTGGGTGGGGTGGGGTGGGGTGGGSSSIDTKSLDDLIYELSTDRIIIHNIHQGRVLEAILCNGTGQVLQYSNIDAMTNTIPLSPSSASQPLILQLRDTYKGQNFRSFKFIRE